MDFDDLDGPPAPVPSRTSRFKPKSRARAEARSEHTLSKPKFHNSATKSEPEESISAAAIPDPQIASVSVKDEDEEEIKDVKVDDPMDEDKEEEDDPIVREIDVFFNPCIDSDTQMYVMQYPLRPSWRPYELDERCEEVRVKPKCSEVQIDLSIDESINWDDAQATKFNMNKQTLCSSSSMQPLAPNYAVGVLVGNKLHLNPIYAVVQLRPSLEHVDSGDLKRKNTENPPEGKSSSSKKQVKHPDFENDQVSEAENWIPLKYHGSKSELSSTYLQKMVAKEPSEMDFTMNPYDYVSSLCPVSSKDSAKSKRPSTRFLLSLTLEERIKSLLLEGPPVQRFSFLKHFAPDYTSEDLLTVLQSHGQLVQGLWVPKTSLLFPDTKDDAKFRSREYILSKFSENSSINLSQLKPSVRVNLRSFLNTFAVERPTHKDWKFKEKPDKAFSNLYPKIEKEQKEIWRHIGRSVQPHFEACVDRAREKPIATHKHGKKASSEINLPKTTGGNQVRTRTSINSETREALLKTVPKVLQNYRVCSLPFICQSLRELAISQSSLPKADPRIYVLAASGAEAPPEELEEIMGQVAVKIHGFYVLKKSPDQQQYDAFRKVVIDLLLASGPDAKLKKGEILKAASVLGRPVEDNEYKKVMSDLCEFKSSAWVLKKGDVVYPGFGSSYGSLDLKVKK